jgi:hypothetical protein
MQQADRCSRQIDAAGRSMHQGGRRATPVAVSLRTEIDMSTPPSWWDDDPELARLRFDSALRGAADAPADRARLPLRVLTFACSRLTLEVEVRPAGMGGRLVPPQPAVVVLAHHDGGSWSAVTDGAGRFAMDFPVGVPRGPVRWRLDTEAGHVIVTEPVAL